MYYSLRRASNHKLRTGRRRARQQASPRLEALEHRLAPATITVTTGLDDVVANDGSVSLREAITALNNGSAGGDNDITSQGPGTFGVNDTIDFNIGGGGAQTITTSSDLPTLMVPAIIDGTSQPGFVGQPLVTITPAPGTMQCGLEISGGNSTVRGLQITNTNCNYAISLDTKGGDTVAGNYLFGDSEAIEAASDNNVVGGVTPADRNVISGGFNAVVIFGSGNTLEGNYIGTDPSGSTRSPNGGLSVWVDNGSTNKIGTPGHGNVIASGAFFGVEISGPSATGNTLASNFIGTNSMGTTGLFNNGPGVLIAFGANGNQVGLAGAANFISGNHGPGVEIQDGENGMVLGTANNFIQGNAIGLSPFGTPLGNQGDGIYIHGGAPNNHVQSIAGAGNEIENNTGAGIDLSDAGTTGTIIQDNLVQNNGNDGVIIQKGAANNTVGNTLGVPGGENVISGNGGNGIALEGSGTSGNGVRGNFIGTDILGANPLGNGTSGVFIDGAANNTIGGYSFISAGRLSGDGNPDFRKWPGGCRPGVYLRQQGLGQLHRYRCHWQEPYTQQSNRKL